MRIVTARMRFEEDDGRCAHFCREIAGGGTVDYWSIGLAGGLQYIRQMRVMRGCSFHLQSACDTSCMLSTTLIQLSRTSRAAQIWVYMICTRQQYQEPIQHGR